MTKTRFRGLRCLLAVAFLTSPALTGCGGSSSGSHVQIGDATKSEVKARSEMYKQRALLKKQAAKSKAASKR